MLFLIVTQKLTKGRCGQIEYAVSIIIVSIFQVTLLYDPLIIPYTNSSSLFDFILLFLLCINIHISTKRFNDTNMDKSKKYLTYFSSVSNALIFLLNFFVFYGVYRLDEPRIGYLSLLIITNLIPILNLSFKESDISIKYREKPVNYFKLFSKLFKDKIKNVVQMDENYIYINNFQFSVEKYQDKFIINSYKDIDDEPVLTKYFEKSGIPMFGFHYGNKYFELTNEEYDIMITEIKNSKNVVFINNPFIVINEINIFIRSYLNYYSIILLKADNEELKSELYLLKGISKIIQNDKYICYKGIKRKNMIWWMKNL
jgi:uncharacterized membrane protein YhaH (DUF805 family)